VKAGVEAIEAIRIAAMDIGAIPIVEAMAATQADIPMIAGMATAGTARTAKKGIRT
jgi:sialic acid synthase SpsE